MRNKKTKNSYEAAYYMMFGAVIKKVVQMDLSKGQQTKRGFRKQWIIYLENIPLWAIMGWNSGMAFGNIHDFEKMRKKLKKMI